MLNFPGVEASRVPLLSENFSVEESVVETEQTTGGFVTGVPPGPGVISNPFGNFLPVSSTRTYTDVLPSANFAFDLSDNLVFRMAVARTVPARSLATPATLTSMPIEPTSSRSNTTQHRVPCSRSRSSTRTSSPS